MRPVAGLLAPWSSLCLLLVALSRGDGAPQSPRNKRWDASPVDVERAANLALLNGDSLFQLHKYLGASSLKGRFLFSFPYPSVDSMTSTASSWIDSKKASLGDSLGLDKVQEVFTEAQEHLEASLQCAKGGWKTMLEFKDEMKNLFTTFEPLKPIFEKSNGLVELITSKTHVETLVETVKGLLGTSDVMKTLSDALHKLSDMLTDMKSFLHDTLSKITGRRLLPQTAEGRALADSWTSLLDGLNFGPLVEKMLGFVKDMEGYAEKLTSVDSALGPLMDTFSAVTGGGRRLDVAADAQKYSSAISDIVPTWQGIEKTGIEMCPHVSDAEGQTSSVKCRVEDFVKKEVGSFVSSMVSGIVGECPEPEGQNTTDCPKEAASAGINDVLGKNSSKIGWFIAIAIAVLGACGVSGAALVKKNQNTGKTESGSDSSSDE